MSQQHVLLVVGQVAGGAGRHVHEIATALSDSGWKVTLACPTEVAERYGMDEMNLTHVPVEIGARPSPRSDHAAHQALRAAAREVDVVHAHGVRAGALACTAVLTSPVVVTLHNAAPAGRAQQLVFAALLRVVAHRASVVLAVSPDLMDEARRRGARDVRLAVVPSAPPRVPEETVEDVRRALGSPTVLALTVGRLAPQKDLGLLLDALALVDPQLGLEVVVAGDGPERVALAERIEIEKLPVRLLGVRQDVPDLLAAADLVISSAGWEGQPVWLQEAMHAGCPAVATDVGGTGGVVGDGGILVPHGDPTALSAAIERLAGDRAARDLLAGQADSQGHALPTRQDALDAVEEAYAAAIARPRRAPRRR